MPEFSAESQTCIDCHEAATPKLVEFYLASAHVYPRRPENAGEVVECLDCHKAEEGDWDAFKCPGSDILTAAHPTAGDCAECHEKEYEQFNRSKHGALTRIFMSASFDRTVMEPAIATKHGCEECHNIGHYWPDGSVGECDACHPKHSFDLAVARNPYTCGECHIGPDHPHIEIWEESKHGNIFLTHRENFDKLGFLPVEGEPPPFTAPTCTTCHMDGGVGLAPTHDVGERLALETQSPWTIRTTEAWGGGLTWQEKRGNMEATCLQCHASPFVERYLLEGDLAAWQYNEIFREIRRWLFEMDEAGIIYTAGFEGLAPFGVAGYDQRPEQIAYHTWHHDGRRFRHGALMMGADWTQWHGIWDLQHLLMEIIEYAADHGLPEAQAWMEDPNPDKIYPYKLYDVPGSVWGIDTLAYRLSDEWTTKIMMNRNGQEGLDAYWAAIYDNVKAAYEANLLSDDQWELWQELYENREVENGNVFPLPDLHFQHLEGKNVDGAAAKEYGAGLELPGLDPWDHAK
ncbi:MAG TPA: cytochrome C [Anaerolineae bacterium]|nr:cytochrome C [Anaerolineae bacterium]